MDCNEPSENPSVLVVSACNKIEPSTIIKMILEKEGHPVLPKLIDVVESFPWHISTKYYETDTMIYALSSKTLLPQNLAKGVEAVIVYFDSSKDNGLEEAESWRSYLNDYEADISILLCTHCSNESSSGVKKLAAQEWCVEHGYELVELEPDVDEEWEAEQDFVETTGVERIVQALHAHVWPNLTLKDRREPTSMSALLHGGRSGGEGMPDGGGGLSQEPSQAQDVTTGVNQLNLEPIIPNLDEGNFEERLNDLLCCGAETDFYQLFGELQTMKERVSRLPNDQRKACAEQVVLAFWRSIGGDADEIEQPPDS